MHSLHDPDRLFRTRSGYVFLCDCCGRLQIVVRNHTLLLYEDDLEPLTNTVNRALKKMQDAADDETWEFKIQTEAGPVSMVLTESSLRSVRNLLQGAWSMYRLRTRTSAVASGEGTAHNVLRDHVAGKSTEEAIFI